MSTEITRRNAAALLTLGAAASCASGEAVQGQAAVANIVEVSLRAFIPAPAVKYPPVAPRVFNGGEKAALQCSLNLATGALSVQRTTGTTREFAVSAVQPVAGKPDWYCAFIGAPQPIAQAQLPADDGALRAHTVSMPAAVQAVRLIFTAGNPLVTGAPAIDAVINVGFRRNAGRIEFMVQGDHDGFPSYRLGVGSRTAYEYDCLAAGETPLALFPPMDRTVAIGWTAI